MKAKVRSPSGPLRRVHKLAEHTVSTGGIVYVHAGFIPYTIIDLEVGMAKIVIDPGHGGTSNIGGSDANHATGPVHGLKEKILTLELGLKCRDMLQRIGHVVYMTRTTDVNLSLVDRAAVAKVNQADAFISIHFNGDDNSSATQGSETHVYTGTSQAADSFALAQLVVNQVAATTGYRNRGVFRTGLGVINPANHYLGTAACLQRFALGRHTRIIADGAMVA